MIQRDIVMLREFSAGFEVLESPEIEPFWIDLSLNIKYDLLNMAFIEIYLSSSKWNDETEINRILFI